MNSYKEVKDTILLTANSVNVSQGSFIQLRIRSKRNTPIRITCDGAEYQIPSGTVTPKFDGVTIVYKDATESEVFIERSTYTLDVKIDNDESFVTTKYNPLTGGSELSGMFALTKKLPTDFEVLFARPVGPKTPISVPSPYNGISGYVVHSSIVFVPQSFNGFKYWMAYTPLPNNDNAYENPCICASNDLTTWVVPNGCPNPLNERVAPAYNRDTHLYFDGSSLILLWNTRNEPAGKTTIKVITSKDGSNWTAPVGIWQGTMGSSDLVSPSIWYDPVASLWRIVGVNSESAGFELREITSTSLLSGWAASPTTLNFPPPAGRKWWHPWFARLSSGRIVGVVMDNDGTAGGSGWVYVAQSMDGVNYESAVIQSDGDVLRVAGNYYRPTMFISEVDGKQEATIIYSYIEKSVFNVQKLSAAAPVSKADTYNRLAAACMMALVAPSSELVLADDFRRADSATATGVALTGQTWTQIDPGNPIGISSNAAYAATTGNCVATIDIGGINYTVDIVVEQLGSQGYLVFNRQDSTHFWRFGHSAGVLQIQRYNGTKDLDPLSATGLMLAVKDILRIDVSGQSAKFYKNGSLVYTANGTLYANNSVIGLQGSGTTPVKFGAIAVSKF